MTNFLIRCQRFTHKINGRTTLILQFLRRISMLIGRNESLDLKRFTEANRLPYTKYSCKDFAQVKKKIGLSIVADSKDFDMLIFTIPAGIEALGSYYGGEIQVVVPNRSVEDCRKKLLILERDDISVVPEEQYIDEFHRSMLKTKFNNRYGWALQQFLKVSQVEQTSMDAVLILDADTILIHPRKWFDTDSKQILFPSWEFNPPYYKILSNNTIGSETPKYTFVTHHMLMQRNLLLEAMTKFGAGDVHNLVEIIVSKASGEESAFCIEYELYGQYLMDYRPDAFFLERWSNRRIPRSAISGLTLEDIRELFINYASISAHDYIKG